jgi:hypothetical protein
MRRLAAALIVLVVAPLPLMAQGRDRSLERISLGLEQAAPVRNAADSQESLRVSARQMLGVPIIEPLPGAPRIGPFSLAAPQRRGEIIRLSVPVGAYVSRTARGLAAANRRRQETAARRRVEAELAAFADTRPRK